MSHIHVNFKEVGRDNKDINKLANKLKSIERDLDNMRFWIDRKIKNRNGIEARLDSAINSIDQLEKQLRTLYAFIEESLTAYENAENKINAVKLDGIDEKSWWEKLGEIADVVVDSLKGFGLGVYDAVVATVEGLAYVVTHPIETLEGLAYVVTHLDEALPAMWDAIVESWDSQVINGDAESRGKFFGRAFGEVALAVVGTKGVDKVLKGGNIVSNSGKVGKTGKAIDGIKKLSDKTVKVVREVGNGVKVAWNSTKKAIGDIRVPVKVNVAYLRTINGVNIPVGINAETKPVKELVQNFSLNKNENMNNLGRQVNGFDTTVHDGKQGKHIPGHNNYVEGKSIMYGTPDDIQELVDEFAGKGERVGKNKERIECGRIIGQYVDPTTGKAIDTTRAMIHYSKKGVHVVPAHP